MFDHERPPEILMRLKEKSVANVLVLADPADLDVEVIHFQQLVAVDL
jgi:hypothetical protein